MLKDLDVQLFLNTLPPSVKILVNAVSNKETWPQDDEADVNSAINELSDIITEQEEILIFADNASALSSIALMKMNRAILLLSIILKYKPNFISEILNEPGETGKDVQHKVILVNRLTFLARASLINSIFSPQNSKLIKEQLAGC
jgi:hypothetical protein